MQITVPQDRKCDSSYDFYLRFWQFDIYFFIFASKIGLPWGWGIIYWNNLNAFKWRAYASFSGCIACPQCLGKGCVSSYGTNLNFSVNTLVVGALAICIFFCMCLVKLYVQQHPWCDIRGWLSSCAGGLVVSMGSSCTLLSWNPQYRQNLSFSPTSLPQWEQNLNLITISIDFFCLRKGTEMLKIISYRQIFAQPEAFHLQPEAFKYPWWLPAMLVSK